MTIKEFDEKYPDKTFGRVVAHRNHKILNYDANKYPNCLVEDLGTYTFCNEYDGWVIGKTEDAVSFAEGLRQAIEYVMEELKNGGGK